MELSGDWPVLDALIRREIGLPGGAWQPEDLAQLLDRKVFRIHRSLERLAKLGLCVVQESPWGPPKLLALTPLGYEDWVALYGVRTLPKLELVRSLAITTASGTSVLMGSIEELSQRLAGMGCALKVEELFLYLWVMRGLGELEVSAFATSMYELRPEMT